MTWRPRSCWVGEGVGGGWGNKVSVTRGRSTCNRIMLGGWGGGGEEAGLGGGGRGRIRLEGWGRGALGKGPRCGTRLAGCAVGTQAAGPCECWEGLALSAVPA